ncbi:hypothetical protein [Sporosarcina sp. P35]|uniref:hypothetical protein n=1 Tax=Sporosarcina sp. P35 TaxID=2048246 RepID=UPI0013043E5F|nr:hypothetical protein [Sporosarcina sp. P35]
MTHRERLSDVIARMGGGLARPADGIAWSWFPMARSASHENFINQTKGWEYNGL